MQSVFKPFSMSSTPSLLGDQVRSSAAVPFGSGSDISGPSVISSLPASSFDHSMAVGGGSSYRRDLSSLFGCVEGEGSGVTSKD